MDRGQRRQKPRAPSPDGQASFLSPDDATILRLVQDNLRLLSELRVSYRTGRQSDTDSRQIRSARDVFELTAPEMAALPQEQMRVLLLDSRNRVLDVVLVYQGNVSTAIVRMAELLRDAIIANAPAVILVHNHPSGDPEPSPEDMQLTKDAAEAAKLLSIELLDHVIVGQGRFVSLKEHGVL